MRKTLVFLALAGVAATALSQEIYKVVSPAGEIAYTDNPAVLASGGRRIDNVPTAPAAEAAATPHSDLRLARLRRISGVTPFAHERNGPHLTRAYWQRQRELAQALVTARMNAAQAPDMQTSRVQVSIQDRNDRRVACTDC